MQSRYGRYTPLAKTLQEDPSCQLCSVLQKYVLQSDLLTIEANLRENNLPTLSTLREVLIMFFSKFYCVYIPKAHCPIVLLYASQVQGVVYQCDLNLFQVSSQICVN